MPREKLHQLLKSLHEELENEPELDAESRQLLDQVLTDVRELGAGPETGPDNEGVIERLEQSTVALEGEYPKFAATLREISETLSRLGI